MSNIKDWLTHKELHEITVDIASLFAEPQASIVLTYRITGTISFDLTGSISEVNATTITLPALVGGYGQGTRGGYREGERMVAGSLLPETETYFLVRNLAITDPEIIDRVTWDSENYRVVAIRRDTLGSHYRIEVVKS